MHGLHVRQRSQDAAVTEWSRLTARDHQVITLLGHHRAMSTDHLARIVFPNVRRARDRLLVLTERGVLARGRPHADAGSVPWVYTLGPVGAAVHALRDGAERVPTSAQTAARVARLVHSRTLPHLLGVNEFFSHLIRYARAHPTSHLDRWEPEHVVGPWTGGIVRPDGYGQWTESGRSLRFFYEHDTGTEPLPTLLDKIDRYGELADTRLNLPVLLDLPTTGRERNVHRAITRRYGPHGPSAAVATRARVPSRPGTAHPDHPADAVWRPLSARTARAADEPVRLVDLAAPTG